MNHLTKVKMIQKLSEEELKRGIPINASWHTKYSESAYIYIGGFPYEMTEGDIVIVFSQYGEIVDCRLVRDKETGKSKGFGFLCYEDQRSTILAVDNLNGTNLCGRIIKVDHVEQYKIPKEYFESENNKLYSPTGPDGKGWGEGRIKTTEELELLEKINTLENKTQKDEVFDEDEKWEREFLNMVESKKKEQDNIKIKKIEKKQKKKEKKAKKEAKRAKRELERKIKDEQLTIESLKRIMDQ